MFRDFQEFEGKVTFKDESYKKLIFAKAYANISNYSVSDLNYILRNLFGGQADSDDPTKKDVRFLF